MGFLIQGTKIGLIGLYALTLLSLFIPFLTEYQSTLLIITGIVIAVHLGEFVMLKSKMTEAAPERSDHFIQTFLYGFGHWLPIIKK